MFPTYLLPSFPFRRRKSSTDSNDSTTSSATIQSQNEVDDVTSSKYIQGHTSYLRCARCAADLCFTSHIISKGFTGRHGRAYLVSGPKNSSRSIDATCLPNTHVHKAVPRQLVTGAHTVSDVSCAFCGSLLGWKYVAAEEETQRYKVGKFILETKKICASTSWENDRTDESAGDIVREAPPTSLDGSMLREDEVQFDSQDEDECEDLFTGIWTPESAAKRRQGKRFGRGTGR
ncbi:hypothetical protein MMC14_005354 [Varicellaria rhodocarpa]|nr:hypothetical protein [Varicellaria rhodocarpa]